jgi:probable phosphoglycerate mutase
MKDKCQKVDLPNARMQTREQNQDTRRLAVYADASVYPHATGLGAVIKDAHGNLIAWRNRAIGAMTSNEAEYHALIFALEQAQSFAPRELHVFSDSKLVVEQMRGLYRVHHDRLRALHRRAGALVEQFERVTFTHISRERNQLADAIADDAVARK